MISKTLIQEVYRELRRHERVTAAGMCHLLADMELPPLFEEAQRSLDWLVANGFARNLGRGPFGPEYGLHESRRDGAEKGRTTE